MDTRQFSLRILEELKQVLDRVDPGAASGLADELLAAERIFLAGAGRSGTAGIVCSAACTALERFPAARVRLAAGFGLAPSGWAAA